MQSCQILQHHCRIEYLHKGGGLDIPSRPTYRNGIKFENARMGLFHLKHFRRSICELLYSGLNKNDSISAFILLSSNFVSNAALLIFKKAAFFFSNKKKLQ